MCRMLETGLGLGKFAGGRPALLSTPAGSSFMSLPDLPILALFFLLMLAGSMHALAASGQFPTARRNAGLRGTGGALLLCASMALVAASLIAGIIAIAVSVPWPAIVLGGCSPTGSSTAPARWSGLPAARSRPPPCSSWPRASPHSHNRGRPAGHQSVIRQSAR